MQPQVLVTNFTTNVTPVEPLYINYDDVLRITSTNPILKIASKQGSERELYITHPDLALYANLDPRIVLMRYQTRIERKCKVGEDTEFKKTKKGYVIAVGRLQRSKFIGDFGYKPIVSPQGKFYTLEHPEFDTFYKYLSDYLLRNFINYGFEDTDKSYDDYMALTPSERAEKYVRFTHSGGKGGRYTHFGIAIRINNPIYQGDNILYPKASFYNAQPRYLYSDIYKIGVCLAGTMLQFADNPQLGFDLSQK